MLVRRAVWDSRRKMLPPVPKTVSDVHDAVDSVEHVTTHRGEKFVMQDDRENHTIILGCESNLNQQAAVDVILMYGTFDCCPKFFAQVLLSTVRPMHISYPYFSVCWRASSRTPTKLCSRKSMRSYTTFRRRRSS
jgi:hypothetical protein